MEDALVKAIVKRVHIRALKAKLSEKKKARRRNIIGLLPAARPRDVEMEDAHEEVRAVVVLQDEISLLVAVQRNPTYSFANTPLKAAQAPLAAAIGSQDWVFMAQKGGLNDVGGGGEDGGESLMSW